MHGCSKSPTARDGRKTSVLFVSGTLSGGGAERFVSTLLQHLNRETFEPSLCLFRDEITYPLPADINPAILGHRGPHSSARTIQRLARTIDDIRPQVVVSIMDYLGMFTGEALRRTAHHPVWVARTSNNPQFLFQSLRGRCRKLWLNRVYPRADCFVANSYGLAESFQNAFQCARGRTHVLLNPVDIDQMEKMSEAEWPEAIDTSRPNLFYSARLQTQKRPDVLIEAFRIIRKHADARLWICGDGPLRRKIEDSIVNHNLRPHIRLLGFRDNTFPLLKAASVAVATSDHEGLPNSILEAQALGVPVVSTRSTFGPEEIIRHGETGLLTECDNPSAVAAAVIRLLSDDQSRSEMTVQARVRTRRKFGLTAIVPQWENFLESRVCATANKHR